METQRKYDRRKANEFTEENPLPEVNRAHRAAEAECIELKERIKALESLLARFRNGFAYPYSLNENLRKQIIAEIDAILPKTEEVKDGN